MARKSRSGLNYEFIATMLMVGFFKAMGLTPFGVKKYNVPELAKNSKKSITFFSSRIGAIYNVFLIVLQICVLFVSLPLSHDIDYPNKTELTTIIEDAEIVFGNTVLFVVWLTLAFRQKTIVKLFNCLSCFDDPTVSLNDDWSSRIYFFSVLFGNISAWVGLLVTERLAYPDPVLLWVNIILPSFVLSWFVMQYAFVAKFIEKRFRYLNRELLEKSIISSVIIEPESFTGRNSTIDRTFVTVIRTVRRSHTNLYEITLEISNFYSVPILITIAFASYAFVYTAYYLIIPFIIVSEEHTNWMLINSVFWLTTRMLPITFLASAVTNIDKEIKNTADVIRRLLSRSTTSRHDDSELKQFAIELLHRKTDFTACGLFPLDYRLVHSIFSMVATYLIILIQFQLANYRKTSHHETRNITTTKSNTSEA